MCLVSTYTRDFVSDEKVNSPRFAHRTKRDKKKSKQKPAARVLWPLDSNWDNYVIFLGLELHHASRFSFSFYVPTRSPRGNPEANPSFDRKYAEFADALAELEIAYCLNW